MYAYVKVYRFLRFDYAKDFIYLEISAVAKKNLHIKMTLVTIKSGNRWSVQFLEVILYLCKVNACRIERLIDSAGIFEVSCEKSLSQQLVYPVL